jgi:hypothetical protein
VADPTRRDLIRQIGEIGAEIEAAPIDTDDPADVELRTAIAAAIHGVLRSTERVLMPEIAGEAADAVIEALAGRLQPAGGNTRTEWGVRVTWDDGSVDEPAGPLDRWTAQELVNQHRRHRAQVPEYRATAELMCRAAATVGPWQPVPTEGGEPYGH